MHWKFIFCNIIYATEWKLKVLLYIVAEEAKYRLHGCSHAYSGSYG